MTAHLLIVAVIDILLHLYISYQCSFVCQGTLVEYRDETDKYYGLMTELFDFKPWKIDEEFSNYKNLDELKSINRRLSALKKKKERQK